MLVFTLPSQQLRASDMVQDQEATEPNSAYGHNDRGKETKDDVWMEANKTKRDSGRAKDKSLILTVSSCHQLQWMTDIKPDLFLLNSKQY